MKNLKNIIVDFFINHYKLPTLFMFLLTLVAGAFFPWVIIDTDPENMLPKDETHRMFHNQAKKAFSLYFSPSDRDAYLLPKIHYKYTDWIGLELGANVFGSDDHTFFSQFENNTNVYMARYSF